MTTAVDSSPTAMSPSDSSDLSLDSPSRQLLRELRLLQIRNRNSFYERLEEKDLYLAREHNAGLAAAAARHEQVRCDAEEMLRQYNLEVERQRKQEEEERRRREETIQRERQAQEAAEDRRRQEAEREKAEEEAARRAAKEKAEAEAAERDRLEAKRKQKEADQKQEAEQRAAEEKAKAEKEKAEIAAHVAPETLSGPKNDNEVEHKRYLEIHQDLKKFRASMKEDAKQNPDLKTRMNNLRRQVRKCVSQLTNVKGANKKPQAEIFEALRDAGTVQEPTVDVRRFLAYPPPQLADSPQKGPALLLFLLNMFSKFALSQLMSEAGASTKSADPVGILIAQVFSSPEFKYQRQYAMIDILLAKFHFIGPVAWGIYGKEGTSAGMRRMGWKLNKNKCFINSPDHYDRMTGLGAGFASIALRNFENSKNPNPFPNSNYWRALANITNVPPDEVQPTHWVFLKAMIEGQEERILTFFGSAGVAALRKALINFPASATVQTAYTRSLTLLAEVMAKDKNIHL